MTQLHTLDIVLFARHEICIEKAVIFQLKSNPSLRKLGFRTRGDLHSSLFEAAANSLSLINLNLDFDSPHDPNAIFYLFQSANLQSIRLRGRDEFPTTEKERLYNAILQHPAVVDVNFPDLDRAFLAHVKSFKEHNLRMYPLTLQHLLLYPPASFRGNPLGVRRLIPAGSASSD